MSQYLLAIDPGACSGWAIFEKGVLQACNITTVDAGVPFPFHSSIDLVIEIPQVYRAAMSKGDPNDLIKVAIEAGQWIERAQSKDCNVRRVLPNEWKGQVPKPIHNRRVLGGLSFFESGLIPQMSESKAHNMIDAIGLGLFALGRMRR